MFYSLFFLKNQIQRKSQFIRTLVICISVNMNIFSGLLTSMSEGGIGIENHEHKYKLSELFVNFLA
jgi:hypothetical protein